MPIIIIQRNGLPTQKSDFHEENGSKPPEKWPNVVGNRLENVGFYERRANSINNGSRRSVDEASTIDFHQNSFTSGSTE